MYSQISFEKHKIFLYREDFQKFMNGLEEAVRYIERNDTSEYSNHTENLPNEKAKKQTKKTNWMLNLK